MKFRFCGDGDCPDWVLAEINATLSALSADAMLRLAQSVVRAMLAADPVADPKPNDELGDVDALKSSFACVRFLLVNATRFGASDAAFDEEMQQLGLPGEHAQAICRVRRESSEQLTRMFEEASLSVNRLAEISCTVAPETEAIDCARIRLRIANEIRNGRSTETEHCLNIERSDIAILLQELRTIDRIMGETQPDEKSDAPSIKVK